MKMIVRVIRIIPSLAGLLAITFACEGNIRVDNNPYEPIVLTAEQEAMAHSGNLFSLSLLEQLDAIETGNYVISPLSLQYILGMILNGANPEVSDEICNVLGFETTELVSVNGYYGRLIREIPGMDKLTEVTGARTILSSNQYSLQSSFINQVDRFYQAQIETVDFADCSSVRKKVNAWCQRNSNGMIDEMISKEEEKNLSSVAALLLDAISFKGVWTLPFNKPATASDYFTRSDGSKIKVKFMKKEAVYPILSSSNYRAIEIPFGNEAFSMRIILPNKDVDVSQLIASLKKTPVETMHFFTSNRVELWLPKFETRSETDCKRVLESLGLNKAFATGAFPRMFDDVSPTLSFIRQKAAISMDETGTTAAAITQAAMVAGAPDGPVDTKIVFHADRPFLYLITEKSTGVILFAGSYKGY